MEAQEAKAKLSGETFKGQANANAKNAEKAKKSSKEGLEAPLVEHPAEGIDFRKLVAETLAEFATPQAIPAEAKKLAGRVESSTGLHSGPGISQNAKITSAKLAGVLPTRGKTATLGNAPKPNAVAKIATPANTEGSIVAKSAQVQSGGVRQVIAKALLSPEASVTMGEVATSANRVKGNPGVTSETTFIATPGRLVSVTPQTPQTGILQENVETTASSTVAATQSRETNPNLKESPVPTTGRPTLFSPNDGETGATARQVSAGQGKVTAPVQPRTQADVVAVSGPVVANSKISKILKNAKQENVHQGVPNLRPRLRETTNSQAGAAGNRQASVKPLDGSARSETVSPTPSNATSRAKTPVEVKIVQDRTHVVSTVMGETHTTAPPQAGVVATPAVPPSPAGPAMTEQITAHIQTQRDDLGEEMTIRLDPPELGKVYVQFRTENGELTGVIRVENPHTLAELNREAPSLMQRLHEAGVQIKTLDLQMGDLGQQGRGESSFAQAQNAYSMFHQHGGDGRPSGYGQDRSESGNDVMENDPHAWTSETGEYVSDTAVNVML